MSNNCPFATSPAAYKPLIAWPSLFNTSPWRLILGPPKVPSVAGETLRAYTKPSSIGAIAAFPKSSSTPFMASSLYLLTDASKASAGIPI